MNITTANEIIAKAGADAIAQIQKIGWKYSVINPSGEEFTNIEKVEPAGPIREKRQSYRDMNITERLTKASPGESVRFAIKEGQDAEKLKKGIDNYAKSIFGKNNYQISIDESAREAVVVCGGNLPPLDLDAALAEAAKANDARRALSPTHTATTRAQ